MDWKSLLFATALVSSVMGQAGAADLSFAHVAEQSDPRHEALVQAAQMIAEKTNGKYEISVFPASQLGDEKNITEGVSLGTVDLAMSGIGFLGEKYPTFSAIGAPYMFRDYDHFVAFSNSDLFEEMKAEYEELTGNHIGGMIYLGARQVTANKPIESPEDMAGMKLRVPGAPLYLMFAEAVGANATSIPFAEVYLALQQGVVEGQENPLPNIDAKKLYEVQSHIVMTNHMMEASMIVVGGHVWDSLSDDEKQIFDEAFARAAAVSSQALRDRELELESEFATYDGVTIIHPELEPFMEKAKPLVTSGDVPWPADLHGKIQGIE